MNVVRPTADEPTNATGWIAYYSTDASGGGYDRPRYLYLPKWYDAEDLIEHIRYEHETWTLHADRWHIEIHRGVRPPVDEIRKYHRNLTLKMNSVGALLMELDGQIMAASQDDQPLWAHVVKP